MALTYTANIQKYVKVHLETSAVRPATVCVSRFTGKWRETTQHCTKLLFSTALKISISEKVQRSLRTSCKFQVVGKIAANYGKRNFILRQVSALIKATVTERLSTKSGFNSLDFQKRLKLTKFEPLHQFIIDLILEND